MERGIAPQCVTETATRPTAAHRRFPDSIAAETPPLCRSMPLYATYLDLSPRFCLALPEASNLRVGGCGQASLGCLRELRSLASPSRRAIGIKQLRGRLVERQVVGLRACHDDHSHRRRFSSRIQSLSWILSAIGQTWSGTISHILVTRHKSCVLGSARIDLMPGHARLQALYRSLT